MADGQNPLLLNMSESSGSEDEFDEIDVYSMDLYDRSAKVKDILAKIRDHAALLVFEITPITSGVFLALTRLMCGYSCIIR